jgi:hypothetical protein
MTQAGEFGRPPGPVGLADKAMPFRAGSQAARCSASPFAPTPAMMTPAMTAAMTPDVQLSDATNSALDPELR